MVFLRFFGVADLIAAAAMILLHFDLISGRLGLMFAIYLMGKGIAFRTDFASIVDFIVGLYIVGMIVFGLHSVMMWIFSAWLLQKAFLSIISN